jgi:hypothetical protein
MGIASAWSSVIHGNFSDGFGYLFVPESEVTRSNELDNRLAQEVADDAARGVTTQEQADLTYSRIAAGSIGAQMRNPETSPTQGFIDGLYEGAGNIRKFGENTIGTVFGLGARIIPWQVWLALGLALIIWLWPFVGPIFKRRFAGK